MTTIHELLIPKPMSSSPVQLSSFPEELLEGILAHCVVASHTHAPRPSWTRTLASGSSTTPTRSRLAILLVCKKFYRIAIPLYYNTIHIQSPLQLNRLMSNALRPNPALASNIRRVIFAGIWADGGELLRMASDSIRLLDVSIDITQLAPNVSGQVRDLDAEEFCEGLKDLSSLKHLVLRKSNHVYLTQPKPKYFLSEVAKAMCGWNELEYVELAFRLSDDSGNGSILQNFVPGFNATTPTTTSVTTPGSITALTQSLSVLPKLHTLSTLLPSMWNETILRVSANPALERIILGEQRHDRSPVAASTPYSVYSYHHNHSQQHSEQPTNHGILGTGLYFMEAKKHTRLSELIKAGTSIIRSRAHTLDMSRSRNSMLSPMLSQAQALASTSAGTTPKSRGQQQQVVLQPQPAPHASYSRARAVSTRRY